MLIVKYLLPAIRAKLVKELIDKHNFRSKDAAEILGLTQAAVSQYLSSKRGQLGIKLIENSEEAEHVIHEIVEKIVSGEFHVDEEVDCMCRLCEILKDEIIEYQEVLSG